MSNASIHDFVKFLCVHLADCEYSSGSGSVPTIPDFALTPYDCLDYASEALDNLTDANKINCLGHLKRAAECGADTFLGALNISANPRVRNLPNKMAVIASLGLIPSRSIIRLNTIRNKVEHEYAVPNIDDLSLYFDIVSGFVTAMEASVFMLASDPDMLWIRHHDGKSEPFFGIDYRFETSELNVSFGSRPQDSEAAKWGHLQVKPLHSEGLL